MSKLSEALAPLVGKTIYEIRINYTEDTIIIKTIKGTEGREVILEAQSHDEAIIAPIDECKNRFATVSVKNVAW